MIKISFISNKEQLLLVLVICFVIGFVIAMMTSGYNKEKKKKDLKKVAFTEDPKRLTDRCIMTSKISRNHIILKTVQNTMQIKNFNKKRKPVYSGFPFFSESFNSSRTDLIFSVLNWLRIVEDTTYIIITNPM